MNPVHIDIKRVEFAVTKACSGKCRHCSAVTGVAAVPHAEVDAGAAVKVICDLAGKYAVESMMTFGGEPLLYADTVCKIHAAARDCGIPVRQIITNGFFSRSERKINDVAAAVCASGANNILLSADAFHQEHIPIEPVVYFAEALLKNGASNLRVHPAWLVNERHQNPYNDETRRLLKIFNDMGINSSSGNDIFPSGNAIKYLSEYFPKPESVDLSVPCGEMPYTGRPDEIESICIDPNGDVVSCSFAIGNIYRDGILSVLDKYDPYGNPAIRALLEGGAASLLAYAAEQGINIDASGCYSPCEACRKAMSALKFINVL